MRPCCGQLTGACFIFSNPWALTIYPQGMTKANLTSALLHRRASGSHGPCLIRWLFCGPRAMSLLVSATFMFLLICRPLRHHRLIITWKFICEELLSALKISGIMEEYEIIHVITSYEGHPGAAMTRVPPVVQFRYPRNPAEKADRFFYILKRWPVTSTAGCMLHE